MKLKVGGGVKESIVVRTLSPSRQLAAFLLVLSSATIGQDWVRPAQRILACAGASGGR